MRTRKRVYIGIGSNLGEPSYNCLQAIDFLDQQQELTVQRKSSLYKTEPIGYSEQPWFVNAVVEAETSLDPWQTLEKLLRIEASFGRKREARWGPRVLDLDLLFYNDRILEGPTLTLPHPRIQERKFVLLPLAEISPDLYHPLLGKSIRELLEGLESEQKVIRIKIQESNVEIRQNPDRGGNIITQM